MGIVHEGDFSFGLKSVIHCACRSCRCRQCKSSTTGLLQPVVHFYGKRLNTWLGKNLRLYLCGHQVQTCAGGSNKIMLRILPMYKVKPNSTCLLCSQIYRVSRRQGKTFQNLSLYVN
jgi:hypothetical protein